MFVNRAIVLSFILITSIFGQIDSFYVLPDGEEGAFLVNDYYCGGQLYYTTGCDDNLNFAVAYFIPGTPGNTFFAIYNKSGDLIMKNIIPTEPGTLIEIPHIAINPDGKGILTTLNRKDSISTVAAYQFQTNGTFNDVPIELDLDLGISTLMGIDISENSTVAVSWLKEAGSFTADTLFTKFFDYNFQPVEGKKDTTANLNSDKIMRIKHEFRNDNSSALFIIYGEKNDGTQVYLPSNFSFKNFDSSLVVNTPLHSIYFRNSRWGADVTIGEPGCIYASETNTYDYYNGYGIVYINKYNLAGEKVKEYSSETGPVGECVLDFNGEFLFMHYKMYEENIIAVFDDNLTSSLQYKKVGPESSMSRSFGVKVTTNEEFLVAWNEIDYGDDSYKAQLNVRTGKVLSLFCETFTPDPEFRREDLKLITSTNAKYGNITTFYENFAIMQSGYFTITQNPWYMQLAPPDSKLYYDLYGSHGVKLVYNSNFSYLNYSWQDNIRLYLSNHASENGFSHSAYVNNYEYSIGEFLVVPAGEEDFLLIYQKKNRTHEKHSLAAIKYDKRLNVLIDSLKIEAYLDETTHFSSDITVGSVDHKNYIFWSYCDSTKSNSTVKMRIFNEFFIENDTTIITFKHPENKFLHPKKVFFDNKNKPILAVVVSDSYDSETGKLEFWKILKTYNAKYYYEVIESVIDEVSRVKDCVKLEDDQYLLTYTDAGSGREKMRILTPESGFVCPEYYFTDFAETYTTGVYSVHYFMNKLVLMYDGVYTEDGVTSKAIKQRILKVANVLVGQVDDVIPEDFVIYQNYPNPFNPSTSINFAIPESGKVKFEVYNTLGELIYDPVETDYVSGNHTIKFDGTGYSSGIYLYKLTFGATSKAGKMILLK